MPEIFILSFYMQHRTTEKQHVETTSTFLVSNSVTMYILCDCVYWTEWKVFSLFRKSMHPST